MNTKLIVFFVIIFIIAGGSIISIIKHKSDPIPPSDQTIAASFYPIAHFTEQIVGDKKTVINITPNGVEPHEYAPTPQDIAKANTADLFIFNGAGVDGWAEKAAKTIPPQKTLEIAQHFTLLQNSNDEEHGNEEHEDEEHQNDPHIWLDPILAKGQVTLIKTKLIENDPENTDFYTQNANAYTQQLDALHEDYQKGLANCELREIVVMHNAFSYLQKRYNFTAHHLSGLSSEEEPTSQDVAKIIELVKKNRWSYIFTEQLMNPKFSTTIANETGTQILSLNPIESLTAEEQAQGKTYISVMRENLNNLKKAMNCK